VYGHFLIYRVVVFLKWVCKSKMCESNMIFPQEIMAMIWVIENIASVLIQTFFSFSGLYFKLCLQHSAYLLSIIIKTLKCLSKIIK
jgi:hypothetical protein